jgi:hypothetical protein
VDGAIHPVPARKDHTGAVVQDVVLQRELADGEEELLAPAGVVVGGEVEDDRHEKPDVVDGNGLECR